ncbi:MAG: M28 family peptidase, partial [candidate division Zixibacteria bacterium]|nr:M28 family peptidase [candidate division Zixibacteria bacterium]
MICRKAWRGSLLAILIMFFVNVPLASGSVLIKIELKTYEDYQIAADLGLKAYIKLDNAYIAEIDKDKIERLELNNLLFQIIDETPWTQDYFLVSKAKFRTKVNLSDHGEVLFEKDDLTILKTGNAKILELLSSGYQLNRISQDRTIPLKYNPLPSTSIPFLSYSQGTDSLVTQVSVDSLTSYLEKLQSFDNRCALSDSVINARHWLKDELEQFGIDSVYLHPFAGWDGYNLGYWIVDSNVVAVIPGTVNPDKVIVAGGHYDSIIWPVTDPDQPAPGADDNASGTAAILEMARILANNPLPKTVILIAFGAEEFWMVGSYGYATDAFSQGMDIQVMFNLDMIGHEANQIDMELHKNDIALPYALSMANLAEMYTNLNVHIAPDQASDSWPFSQLGYRILYSEEFIFSSNYHMVSDSVTHLNIPYMSEIVKMNLATIVEVASSPGPVEDIVIWDAGDGEKLYVNWSSLEENDLVEYRLYFGTESGVYTDTHTVLSGYTSDTLRNLENEVPYYIAVSGVNSSGKESIYKSEIVGTPRIVPLPPSGLTAQTGYFKINLSWQPSYDLDFSHYNLYRSITSGEDYEVIATEMQSLAYEDTTVEGGIWYYYVLTAVDTTGYESGYSEEVSMRAITLDQGILVIDESGNSKGNPPYPSSDRQQDSVYAELFSGYRVSYYEYTETSNKPSMKDIGAYSTLVWLDDDYFKSNFVDNSDHVLIEEYLGYGGNFVMFSWRGMTGYGAPYSFLHITWAGENSLADFAGAFSHDTSFYPDVITDTLKYISNWGGLLKYGNIVSLGSGAEPLYYFDSYSDDISFEGKVCGWRYDGLDYQKAFFSFPLYYLEYEDARGLIVSLMRDFGEPLGVEEAP